MTGGASITVHGAVLMLGVPVSLPDAQVGPEVELALALGSGKTGWHGFTYTSESIPVSVYMMVFLFSSLIISKSADPVFFSRLKLIKSHLCSLEFAPK